MMVLSAIKVEAGSLWAVKRTEGVEPPDFLS